MISKRCSENIFVYFNLSINLNFSNFSNPSSVFTDNFNYRNMLSKIELDKLIDMMSLIQSCDVYPIVWSEHV